MVTAAVRRGDPDADGALARIANMVLIGGIVLLVIGAGLILGGVFWKKQPAPAV